jgi:polar amino acid transport system permease protein
LKNSSLASVISVQELTLRSTQLASSTFDFFSIFFASGLIYLALTSAVSVIQLLVERALDLDRPATQSRLACLLPWYRAPLLLEPVIAEPVASADAQSNQVIPSTAVPRDAKLSRSDRTTRSPRWRRTMCWSKSATSIKPIIVSRSLLAST